MGSCLGSCESKEAQTNCSEHNVAAGMARNANSYTSCLRSQATDEQDTELISNASEYFRRRNSLIYRLSKFKSKKKCPEFINRFMEHTRDAHYARLYSQSYGDANDIQLQNLDVNKLLNASLLTKESELDQNVQNTGVNSSRASSSLDLEWEHEYTQLRQQQQQQRPILDYSQDHSFSDQLNTPTASLHLLPQLSANIGKKYNLHSNSVEFITKQLQQPRQRQHQQQQPQQQQQRYRRITRHGSFTRQSCCSSQNSWSHISTPESLEWDVDEEQEQQRCLHLEDDNLDDETLKLLHQIEQLKNHVLQETGDGLLLHCVGSEEEDGLKFNVAHFGSGNTCVLNSLDLETHIS